MRKAIRNVVMWSYERGTWQYDVMCALIVAFILFTPRGFFSAQFGAARPDVSIGRDRGGFQSFQPPVR